MHGATIFARVLATNWVLTWFLPYWFSLMLLPLALPQAGPTHTQRVPVAAICRVSAVTLW
ncbi:hypothetical protein D3C78_1871500 [compost metagenome]